jgi:hypothetical protein
MSATHLKMVGRNEEVETVERLKKPVSGSVAGELGLASRFPASQ